VRFSYAETFCDPSYLAPLAQAAEAAGYDSFVVPDSLIFPAESDTRYPYTVDGDRAFLEDKPIIEPFTLIPFLAATTTRIRFTTFVLKFAIRQVVLVAKQAASIAVLSNDRLRLGVGISPWPEDFAAMDVPWEARGRRMDEMLDVLRACWGPDPVDFRGEFVHLDAMKVQPKPAHPIPIWVGGRSEPAYRRAATRGDGFHAIGLDPAGAALVVERMRRDRPEETFTISLRTGWDPQGMEPDVIRRERDEFEAVGIQHVVSAPWRNDADSWMRSMELLAGLVLDR